MKTARLNSVIQRLTQTALRGEDVVADGELLERYIVRRDGGAFEGLVCRHGAMVLGVCRRILGNEADAHDAFQATFLVLIRRADSIRPRARLCNWLYGVARKCALKARAMNRKRQIKEKLAHDHATVRTQPDPSDEVHQVLDAELARLPDHYRTAVVLCDLEGATIRDAAQRLRCPQGTLATRLRRGRALLARRLSRRGLVLGAASLATALGEGVASAVVPPSLMCCTVEMAAQIGAGSAATALTSAKIIALCEGVLRTMLLTKIKAAAGVLLGALVLVGMGALLVDRARGTLPDDQPVQRDRTGRDAALKSLRGEDGSSASGKASADAGVGWKVHATVPADDGKFRAAAWSIDGKIVAAVSAKKISLIDAATGKSIAELEQADPLGVAFSPTGKLLATSHGTPAKVVLWDLETRKILATRGLAKDNFGAVAFSSDGKILATSGGDAKIILWSVDGILENKGAELRSINEKSGGVRTLAFSPAGKYLAAGRLASSDSAAKVYDVQTGDTAITLDCHKADGSAGTDVLAVAFSPNGKLLATTGADQTACLSVVPSGNLVSRLKGHNSAVTSVAFSPDGKTVATSSDDKTARLWDIPSGKEVATLKEHTKPLTTIGFSPDGRYVMTAGEDALRIWVRGDGPVVKGSGSPAIERPTLYERLAALPTALVKAKKTDDEIIDALYLATLKRLPTEAEKDPAAKHLKNAKDRAEASRDLVWSLANSIEFLQLYGLDGNTAAALKEINEKLGKALDRK